MRELRPAGRGAAGEGDTLGSAGRPLRAGWRVPGLGGRPGIVALLIVLLGFFITKYLARAVLIAGVTAGIEYSKALSELVRVLLFVLVFAMALEELAIAPRVVLAAFVIFFGAIGAAAAVAFGLAGRDYARRAVDYLLSRHEGDDIDQL